MSLQIRPMEATDWEQVKQIYQAGIDTGHATFETSPPSYEKWVGSAVPECTLVITEGDTVAGWCKLSPVSDRCVYAGVGEVSVYVDPDYRGQGVGVTLLNQLIQKSEEQGFWTLNAGIFPENQASLLLHKKLGFREVGIRERIGKLHGVWRDVLLLERRSAVVGVE